MSHTQTRIPLHGLSVYDNGRVTIPRSARNRYQNVTGDEATGYITFELDEPGDGDVFDAKVDTSNKFYIPARFRDRYDIEDGDYVDLYLLVGGAE